MKKSIFVSIFAWICALTWVACKGDYTTYHTPVVVGIEAREDNKCWYEVESKMAYNSGTILQTTYIVDSCGKFNIGDTIVFNKK